MLERRHLLGLAITAAALPGAAIAQTAPSAAVRLKELGPENEVMARRVGLWDVTQTAWQSPDSAPVTIALLAERRMIGSMLQEILRPASDASGTAIDRMDYLHFNRVEGRWDYVSMDLRVAVGIMPAWSFTRGQDERIVLTFQPFAMPGTGANVTGQMLRMDQVITLEGPDRDMKEQHFIMADGTGTMWLANRYAYARRPS